MVGGFPISLGFSGGFLGFVDAVSGIFLGFPEVFLGVPLVKPISPVLCFLARSKLGLNRGPHNKKATTLDLLKRTQNNGKKKKKNTKIPFGKAGPKIENHLERKNRTKSTKGTCIFNTKPLHWSLLVSDQA